MSNSRKCPDCKGPDLSSIFGGKGNGECRYCDEGKIHDIGDALVGLAGFDNYHYCEYCSGTGQCQTCGGTGYEYYDSDSYSDSESSESSYSSSSSSESYYSSDYSSYSDYSYSPSPSTPYVKPQTSNYSGVYFFVLLFIISIIVISIVSNSGNSNKNNIVAQQPTVIYNVQPTIPDYAVSSYRNFDALNGIWVKTHGWSNKGTVISFSNGVGKIVSVPGEAYKTGIVQWKNFDPERNWLQVFEYLTDSYSNTEVKFINKDTIELTTSGDVYARQK